VAPPATMTLEMGRNMSAKSEVQMVRKHLTSMLSLLNKNNSYLMYHIYCRSLKLYAPVTVNFSMHLFLICVHNTW